MIKKENLPPCDIATTVEIMGSKWKLLIIRELLEGPKRPSHFKKTLGISQKVLTETLNAMIEDGIIEKKVYEEKRPHVEYELTELGNSLRQVMAVMKEWGKWYKQQMSTDE